MTSLFTHAEQVFINCKIAEFCSDAEIARLLLARFGVRVAVGTIKYYRYDKHALREWGPFREEHRRKWLAGLSDIELAHKRNRVEALQRLYYRAEKAGEFADACRVLEQIRKEMEGDPMRVSGGMNIQVENKPTELTTDMIVERRLP